MKMKKKNVAFMGATVIYIEKKRMRTIQAMYSDISVNDDRKHDSCIIHVSDHETELNWKKRIKNKKK